MFGTKAKETLRGNSYARATAIRSRGGVTAGWLGRGARAPAAHPGGAGRDLPRPGRLPALGAERHPTGTAPAAGAAGPPPGGRGRTAGAGARLQSERGCPTAGRQPALAAALGQQDRPVGAARPAGSAVVTNGAAASDCTAG